MPKECAWDARPLYEKLIDPLRARSQELGYALAVHGTLKRDIDLIAVPWTAEAVPARELAEALIAVSEQEHGLAHLSWYPARGAEFTREGAPGMKPHGRLGWVINLSMGAGPYIDLTVMPRSDAPVIVHETAESPHANSEPLADA